MHGQGACARPTELSLCPSPWPGQQKAGAPGACPAGLTLAVDVGLGPPVPLPDTSRHARSALEGAVDMQFSAEGPAEVGLAAEPGGLAGKAELARG